MKAIVNSLKALKEEDHRRAFYASLVFIMLMILFFLLVSLEEPDPPLKEKIVEIDMENIIIPEEFLEASNSGGSDGGANPEYNKVPDPAPKIDTQKEQSVNVNSGNGNQTNNQNNNTQPQPDQSLGFNGTTGNDSGDGKGGGFGDGDGVNQNSGNTTGAGTSNPNRKITTKPTFNGNAQEEGKIALDIWVDAEGNVVQTRFKESKSTSGSAYLISLAERAAKTMKYEKKPGVDKEHVGYEVFEFKKI